MPTLVGNILSEELTRCKDEIISSEEAEGMVATGKTKASYQVEMSDYSGQLIGAGYTNTFETGRGPAREGNEAKQAFIDNLKEWIKARGIVYKDEGDLYRLANFFRWYMNKHGNKLYRSGRKQDIFTTAIESMQTRVIDRIAALYTAEIVNKLKDHDKSTVTG